MERQVGEIFTYQGKTYQVVKVDMGIGCIGCAFRISGCNKYKSFLGRCSYIFRRDNTGVIFKLINNNNMEIKNNQLTIDIPEGMKIDLENSDLAKGIVKFKQSTITYEDVEDVLKLCIHRKSIIIYDNNASKLVALSRFMNIAKYYNGDWEPDWNISNWNTYREPKYYIYYKNSEDKYGVDSTTDVNFGNIYFKSRDDAKSVIDNPNFRCILDAIYRD
jgi:hypothetical protein